MNRLRIWIQALRPFSYTASMAPVFYAAAYAVYLDKTVHWILFTPVVFAAFCIHAAVNLVSEYFDYVKGVDRPETLGGSRVLVEKLLRPGEVMAAGIFLFAVTTAMGIAFIIIRGMPMLMIGAAGIAGGIFYTASPAGLKYRGLGDLTVFVMMGPLMVIGAFYVLTGGYDHRVLVTSLPIGCMVAAILSGNNLRDIEHDGKAGIKTTAGVLGSRWARIEYSGLIIAAYVVTAGGIIAGALPLWSLLVFVSVPIAVKNLHVAAGREIGEIASLDVQTAKLHLVFGLLLIVSIILGSF